MDNPKISAAYLAPALEHLGQGLNIFTEGYLMPPGNGKVLSLKEEDFDIIPVRQTTATETFGSNFAVFIQDFSVAAGLDGSYKGFTASVESKFAKSTRDSIDTKFAQMSLLSVGYYFNVSHDPKKYLTKEFKQALENDKPEDLFAQYGTHVAIRVTIGGMITYYAYSKTTERLSDVKFEAAARAKYLGYGAEVGANAETTHQQKEEAKTVEGSISLYVNGGDETARINVEHGAKDSFAAWAATIDRNPGFLGFRPGGLTPIWMLTENKERRAAIHLAFNQMAARQFQIRIFTHTGEVAQHPEARVHIPSEYKLLAGGARDNFAPGGGNLLTASFPDGDSVWIGRGKDHHAVSPANVSVFAVGIYDNLGLWEVAHSSATGNQGEHPSAEVALCEGFVAKDGVLVGGGAAVVDGPGSDKMLTSSYPKNATTWAAAATDPQNSNPAKITVYAVGLRCLVEGIKIEVKTNHLQSRREAHPSQLCSPNQGFTLTGGGALVDYGTGPGNLLTSSYPENERTWAASSKDQKLHSPATITTYAIGLKVS